MWDQVLCGVVTNTNGWDSNVTNCTETHRSTGTMLFVPRQIWQTDRMKEHRVLTTESSSMSMTTCHGDGVE
jgi:hypothetical protein